MALVPHVGARTWYPKQPIGYAPSSYHQGGLGRRYSSYGYPGSSYYPSALTSHRPYTSSPYYDGHLPPYFRELSAASSFPISLTRRLPGYEYRVLEAVSNSYRRTGLGGAFSTGYSAERKALRELIRLASSCGANALVCVDIRVVNYRGDVFATAMAVDAYPRRLSSAGLLYSPAGYHRRRLYSNAF